MRVPKMIAFVGLLLCVAGMTGCQEKWKLMVYNHTSEVQNVEFSDSAYGHRAPATVGPNQHVEIVVKADKSDLPVSCTMKTLSAPENRFSLDKSTARNLAFHIEDGQIVGPLDKKTEVRTSTKTNSKTTEVREVPTGEKAPAPGGNSTDNGGSGNPGRVKTQEEVVE